MQNPPTLRLFTDRSHYKPDHRNLLLHVLRPMLVNQPSASWLQSADGRPLFELVPEIDESDICVLPMTWNYYVDHGKQSAAVSLAQLAEKKGKLLLVIAAGDHEPVVPISNAVVFHPGPNRSVRRVAPHAFAQPSSLPD